MWELGIMKKISKTANNKFIHYVKLGLFFKFLLVFWGYLSMQQIKRTEDIKCRNYHEATAVYALLEGCYVGPAINKIMQLVMSSTRYFDMKSQHIVSNKGGLWWDFENMHCYLVKLTNHTTPLTAVVWLLGFETS